MEPIKFSWQSKQGLKLFAQAWSPAEQDVSAVVAFVHGLGEHSDRYPHVAQAFNKASMAFVTFDLPGHGQSEGKRGVTSFDEIADEIDHLLAEARQRYPGKPLYLYGHSLGGVIVLYHLVTRRPKLRAAIATSPGLMPGSPVAAYKVLLGRVLNRLMPSVTVSSGLDAANISRDPQVVEKYRQDPLVHDQVSTRLGWDILTCGEHIIAQAGNLQTPLLVTAGTGDHIVSMQAIQAFVERAPHNLVTLKLFDGGFHEPHNDYGHEEAINFVVNFALQQQSDENGILAPALNTPS